MKKEDDKMINLVKIVKNLVKSLSPHQKQQTLFWGAIGLVGSVFSAVVWNLVSSQTVNSETYGAEPTEKIVTGANRLNPQEAWHENMTMYFDEQKKEIADLKESLKALQTQLVKKEEKNTQVQEMTPSAVQNQMNQRVEGSVQSGNVLDVSSVHGQNVVMPSEAAETKGRFRSTGISKTVIALQNSRINQSLETVDNTLPPGAFAKGVLLSGVVAATSASSSANPEPILIELADNGDLSRNFKSTVHGCRIIGSAYGVLAKERIMARLEQLTCIEKKTGEIVTVSVDGYVVGEDGENGLRGKIIDRAGEHIRTAFATGFLASFSNFLSASSNPVSFATQSGIASITPLSGNELLKQGFAKGSAGALDKFTEFYIKRAEGMDPVILVNAGRVLDVVFTKSVQIGTSLYRKKISAKNDTIRRKMIEDAK